MTSIGRWIDAIRRFWGRGVCPHELSFTLTLGLRRLILTPETLVERLELAPDDVVLELGPGPGYFSPTVAQALPQGSLLLLDIQRPMLEKASLRVEQVAPTGRTVAVQGDAEDLPVADASVDVAFW